MSTSLKSTNAGPGIPQLKEVTDSLESIKTSLKDTHPTFIPEGHKLILKQDRAEDYGRFQAIGELGTTKNRIQDIFDKLGQVSSGAYHKFLILKDCRNPDTNLCSISQRYTTRSEQVVFNRKIAELKKIQLIRKAKVPRRDRQEGMLYYLLSPHFIRCRQYRAALDHWETLKE